MSPVLVTGAGGYLGKRILVAAALAGMRVLPVSRKQGDPTIRACDLLDADAVRQLVRQSCARTAIHCAAVVPRAGAEYADDSAAAKSLRMVDNLIHSGVEHIVFTSSMTVYGKASASGRCREGDELAPISAYGKGKAEAERRLIADAAPRATILRLPGLFGASRRSGLLYNVAKALVEGRPASLPRAPVVWAALHVDDAADLCMRAAYRSSEDKLVVNSGYPGVFSTTRAVNLLAELVGCAPLTEMAAPEFEMDLTRLSATLGLPRSTFRQRLEELVGEVRSQVAFARPT